ncbi:hypothetical protein GA0115236_14242, partial [Streptomyces sp. IgraMP-1]
TPASPAPPDGTSPTCTAPWPPGNWAARRASWPWRNPGTRPPGPSTGPARPCSPRAIPAPRPERNRLTHPAGDRQLRLGRDGLWYGYISDPGREDWWPTGTPGLDPVAVFGALPGGGA